MIHQTISKHIWVTFQFVGFHHWPDAPEVVSFLRALHRHVFHVKVGVRVVQSDRDVEFFILKNDVRKAVTDTTLPELLNKPSMSCEMLAESIGSCLLSDGYNVMSVEVSEDGENGGVVTYDRA